MSDADQLQELLDGLAVRLQRAVSLEDPQLRLIAYSETGEDADPVRLRSILRRESPDDVRAWLFAHGLHELREPTILPALADLGMRERVVCPVRHAGALLGYLWVQEAGDADLIEAAAATADVAGVILYRRRLEQMSGRMREVMELGAAVFGDTGRGGSAAPVAVVRTGPLGEAATLDLHARLEQALRRQTGGAGGRCLQHEGELVLAGAGAEDLRAALAAVGSALPTGIGGPLKEARRAALIAELLRASSPLTLQDVPLEAHVLAAAADDPSAIPVPAVALVLLAADPELAWTIETYLDLGGDVGATTAALNVSRAGLYRRLHRAEEAAGFALHDGPQRTLVHLGLKAARLAQAGPAGQFPARA